MISLFNDSGLRYASHAAGLIGFILCLRAYMRTIYTKTLLILNSKNLLFTRINDGFLFTYTTLALLYFSYFCSRLLFMLGPDKRLIQSFMILGPDKRVDPPFLGIRCPVACRKLAQWLLQFPKVCEKVEDVCGMFSLSAVRRDMHKPDSLK